MRRSTRAALLVLLLAAAASAGLVSVRRSTEQLAVLSACEAAAAGDWNEVLAGTAGRVGGDATGRAAAECRCLALLARDEPDACADLLERVLADPASAPWAPRPDLAVHWVQTLRDRGRAVAAAEAARRAAAFHPGDSDLFYLELVTRSSVEDEARVLEELAARAETAGAAAGRMRVSLANRHLLRGDPARALAALGDDPPPAAQERVRARWFETRGMAFASAGDLPGTRAVYAAWERAGGDPDELLARYALTLSIAGLADPDEPAVALLRRGLEASAGAADPQLRESLGVRLALTLVAAGETEAALATYDALREELALEGLRREELERADAHRDLHRLPVEQRRGALRFALHGATDGVTLLVSPPADVPVDSAYQTFALAPAASLRVERNLGPAPVRWVARDAAGAAVASGTVHPTPGRTVDAQILPGPPVAPVPVALSRLPADGRRRVVLLLLDCADWRIAQYLRARGELPVLDALIESGHRAVLHSDPPLTAAALEALVWPGRRGAASLGGLVHRFGVELAGLASVGDNPFDFLEWVLPAQADLFSTVGAGERVAANLLFTHGGIDAGRHGELSGPHGARRRVPVATSARDLDSEERALFPALAAVKAERDAVHLRAIAAELDAAEELIRGGEVDLVALRVEPLDILTHAHFAEAVRTGQDDGEGLLFSVYRYLDWRIAEVHDALDADDVLIVMSDHGIRTAMEHSEHAIFVATGAGVPVGRAPGRPALRGVPRFLADLLAIETAWPDTDVAPWARAIAAPAG